MSSPEQDIQERLIEELNYLKRRAELNPELINLSLSDLDQNRELLRAFRITQEYIYQLFIERSYSLCAL